MPSDCQCSTACTVTKTVTKVLNNKEATQRIRKLEREVEALREENSILKRKANHKLLTKKQMVKDLKKHLDRL